MKTDEFESKQLDLAQLVDCPLNTRPIDTSDPALHDLGNSLAQRQEVDLIVRQVGDTFEVLDGKRRLAAARLRNDVPKLWCQVRPNCTDAEALQVIIVTQLHRANLDPMAEAALVRQLLDTGATYDHVAAQLGRGVPWVAKRAKLTELATPWRTGLAAGSYPWATVAHLELIARLPDLIQREMATEYLKHWKVPGSVAEFDEEIRDQYLHALRYAPWKSDDLALLPRAGACTACPNRSGCQSNLFSDQPEATDRCLDATCWAAKLNAHTAAKARALAEKNPKVLIIADQADKAPAKLPDQAIVLSGHGLEECRKADDGAMPAINAETGKQTWMRATDWAPSEVRKSLGLPDKNAGKTKSSSTENEFVVTAEHRRQAKRLALRMRILDEEIVDADAPSPSEILALYVTFRLGGMNPLTSIGWSEFKRNARRPQAELAAELWDDLIKNLHCLRGAVRPADMPDEEAIAALERLATLDPAEQAAKALTEIPEPKRKG